MHAGHHRVSNHRPWLPLSPPSRPTLCRHCLRDTDSHTNGELGATVTTKPHVIDTAFSSDLQSTAGIAIAIQLGAGDCDLDHRETTVGGHVFGPDRSTDQCSSNAILRRLPPDPTRC